MDGANNGFISTVENPTVVAVSAKLSDAGVYKVRLTTKGCSTTDSTVVSVYDKITPVVTGDTTVCQGSTVVLSAARTTGATTYTWAPSTGLDNTNQSIVNATPTQTTTYTVTMGNGGCYSIDQQVTVTVIPKPVADAGPTKRILSGESVVLNGMVKGGNLQYFWTPTDYLDNPQSMTPTATPPDNIRYTLHAISDDNCGVDTSSVYVRVFQENHDPKYFYP